MGCGGGRARASHLTFKWVCHNDESAVAQTIKKTSLRLSTCVTEAVCHFSTGSRRGRKKKKCGR